MMGVDLAPLTQPKELSFKALRRKKIAVDTYLELYQFLRTMPELRDSKGRLTSHLSGLFFRTTHLMQFGIKLAFVFDGPFSEVGKHRRIVRGKFEPRITETLTKEIIAESKQLLKALGCPVIQAPSEGEAQAAYMAAKGAVWGVASQDYDCLMFDAPRLIRYLTISRYRRLPKGGRAPVRPQLIELSKLLRRNKINKTQLIALCILTGTDFNPRVPGVGPKTALQLVKKHKMPQKLFRKVKPDFDWRIVYDLIRTMPVTDRYRLRWAKPNVRAIKKLLVKEHDFSAERIKSALKKIKK